MTEGHGSIDLVSDAEDLIKKGEIKKAAFLYESAAKIDRRNEKLLARLMFLYRKLKNYRKELSCIDKAIAIQEEYYQPKKAKKPAIIDALSRKINLSLGRIDRKGEELHLPDSILKLKKRKESVVRKMSDVKK